MNPALFSTLFLLVGPGDVDPLVPPVPHIDGPRAVVTGVVVDSLGFHLPGWMITIPGRGRGALTGNDGRFRLEDVPPGETTLLLFEPCEPRAVPVLANERKPSHVRLYDPSRSPPRPWVPPGLRPAALTRIPKHRLPDHRPDPASVHAGIFLYPVPEGNADLIPNTVRLDGQVADLRLRKLSGARLRLPDVGITATAGVHGRFRFPDLLPGNYRIVVTHPGFDPVVSRMDLSRPGAYGTAILLQKEGIEVASEPVLIRRTTSSISCDLRPPIEWPPPRAPFAAAFIESRTPAPEPDPAPFLERHGVSAFLDPRGATGVRLPVHVDAESYRAASKHLSFGRLPPPDSVRVEEFVNLLPSADPPGREALEVHGELAPSPFREDTWLLRVGIRARTAPSRPGSPRVQVWVVESTGPMYYDRRLETVRRSLNRVIDGLRPNDRVGLVRVGASVEILHPVREVGDARALRAAVAELHSRGCAEASDGLEVGLSLAEEGFLEGSRNQLLLVSSGLRRFGVHPDELLGLRIRRAAEQGGEFLSLELPFDETPVRDLKRFTDGVGATAHSASGPEDAERWITARLGDEPVLVARRVGMTIRFPDPGIRSYRPLGFEDPGGASLPSPGDELTAGEAVTALFEVRFFRPGTLPEAVAAVQLGYVDAETGEERRTTWRLAGDAALRDFALASPRFRFLAAAAEFAEILRGSYWTRENNLGNVLAVAHDAAGHLDVPQTGQELVWMVKRTAELRAGDSGR